MILYFFYRLGFFLAGVIPLAGCYATAGFVSSLYYYFSKRDKKAMEANLRVILGEGATQEEINSRARSTFTNFAKYLVDFFKFSGEKIRKVSGIVEIKNTHYIDEALSYKKGVILLSTHIGNWEFGAYAIASNGYKLNALVLEHKDRRINEIFTRQREVNGVRGIPVGGMQLKECFNVLRSNGLLAIVGDRDYTGGGEVVDFFGNKTVLPKGPAALSIRTGAPIVIAYMIRKKDDTYLLEFEEPIRPLPEAKHGSEENVRGMMSKYIVRFERLIRKYPDQWYMFDNIWPRQTTTQ